MKTEKTLTGIFLIGLILKMLDVPGASLVLSAALCVLSMLYFPLAFYFFSDKTLKTQNIVLSIVGGMVLAMIPIGVLFKLMYWPGAKAQLTAGIVLTPILLIITYFLYKKSPADLSLYYKSYLTRIIFWLAFCIVFYFVTKRQILQIQHRNNPELIDLKINAYDHPENVEYQNALNNYYKQHDSLDMVKERQN